MVASEYEGPPAAPKPPQTASEADLRLVRALRAGDERVFAALVDESYASLALTFVRSRAVAEEVVQETWLGALKGLDRFEGRSSLKTWIFRILTNTAKTRAEREGRSIPFSSLGGEVDEPSVSADRFLDAGHPTWAGHWSSYPQSWADLPEHRLLSNETRRVAEKAMDALPATQRLVVRLRDVEGFSSEEVCDILNISEANQRVLLHRARSRVRAALERHFEESY